MSRRRASLSSRNKVMHAERVVLETDDQGNLQGLPKLPPRNLS